MVLVSHEPYSYHIYLVIKDIDIKQKVTKLLSDYLIYQEHPHKTLTDKMTEWLTKLMPSEKDFIQEVKPVSAGKEFAFVRDLIGVKSGFHSVSEMAQEVSSAQKLALISSLA